MSTAKFTEDGGYQFGVKARSYAASADRQLGLNLCFTMAATRMRVRGLLNNFQRKHTLAYPCLNVKVWFVQVVKTATPKDCLGFVCKFRTYYYDSG